MLAVLSLMLFVSLPGFAFASPDQSELNEYLEEINFTEVELQEYLASFGSELSDFYDVEDLRDFLGRVITEEVIEEYLMYYEIDRDQLVTILADYGEEIEYLKFEYDLDFYLWDYFYDEEWDEEWDWDEDFYNDFMEMLAVFDIDEEEYSLLLEHFEYVHDTTPDFEERLDRIADRLLALDDFESASELAAEEIAEILTIIKELTNLLQLDIKFYLIKDGDKEDKTSIKFSELISITSLDGYDLLIEFYNLEGVFLADIIISADMFGSDLLKETGENLKEVSKEVSEKEVTKKEVKEKADESAPVSKTEKGGKLPKTASDYPLNMMIGFLLAFAGLVIFRKVKAA